MDAQVNLVRSFWAAPLLQVPGEPLEVVVWPLAAQKGSVKIRVW